ncbi:hypothetical protein [Skermania piniformis]|uniref:Uncharacterized protein n=1 Tax=Skermania pinensis TaxID=39122 RepID=A0ABX8SB11_9ACTN|nr:hypothetical protein [Skermania piniformis]QXQ15055.1 hypothetical protein KV203_06795 [Skermania piniformis]
MADPLFPTRQFPYRRPDPGAGPDRIDDSPLPAGVLHRQLVGRDPTPIPLDPDELVALQDPFAELLRHGRFPLTMRDLTAELDSAPPIGGALPAVAYYMVGDGGQLPWTPATATVNRQLRVVITRSRRPGSDPDLLVSTSIRLASPTAFLQVIGWDEPAGVFRFYERRRGTWILAGDSFDALRPPGRGEGPFDSHVNGGLNMKELKLPWSHWHSQSAAIQRTVLGPDDPFLDDPIWELRSGGERFETEVARAGVQRWTAARMRRMIGPDRRLADLPAALRQVLTTTTVNLVSTAVESSRVRLLPALDLPLSFFLDADALLGPLGVPLDPVPTPHVSGAAYADAVVELELRLDDGAGFRQPGETFFAFLVPERAMEDQSVLNALLRQGVLSRRLALGLLLVDFPNPVYSARRAALLRYFPPSAAAGDGGGELDRLVPAAIAAAGGAVDGPEAEFTEWWERSAAADFELQASRVLADYLAACQRRLDAPGGAADLIRLAQGRRRRFRRSRLAEFALTLPYSPGDDVFESLRRHPDGTVS